MFRHRYSLPSLVIACTFLAACGGGAVEPAVTAVVNPVSPSYSHLQFVVGTANIAGTPGLNTMVTLRQANGLSAVGYSTPTIAWDGNFVNSPAASLDGPTPNIDDGTKHISGTLAAALGSSAPVSTFGQGAGSWGAFGYGLYPANSGAGNVNSTIVYPCLPVYSAYAAGYSGFPVANACSSGAYFIGGPPAFPEIQNGSGNAGQLGATLGFTPFLGLQPAPNTATGVAKFSLTLQVPTGFSGNTATFGQLAATATLSAFTPLGTFATPTFTPDNAGGGTFAYALPSGVSEAYLFLVNLGPDGTGSTPNCNYGSPPYYYTIHVTRSSGSSATLPDNLGPAPAVGTLGANESTATLCSSAQNSAIDGPGTSADQYIVYATGFDYPAYASSYPNSNGNATPAIAGPNGQADITISAISATATYPTSTRRRVR